MRGAFVIQVRKVAPNNRLEGVVEEVDTGKQATFSSENELLEFLRERLAQLSGQFKDGTNGPKDDRR